MDTLTRRRWNTPDMAEAAGRTVRLAAIADGHDERAEDCWQVWLDGLDDDEAGTLASDEEIRAAFGLGWDSVERDDIERAEAAIRQAEGRQ